MEKIMYLDLKWREHFNGWWPAKAVTFIDNHDTGSTQHMWPFPTDKVMQGYAYILTHPDTPMIVSYISNTSMF